MAKRRILKYLRPQFAYDLVAFRGNITKVCSKHNISPKELMLHMRFMMYDLCPYEYVCPYEGEGNGSNKKC